MAYERVESLRELRNEKRALQADVRTLRAKLEEATLRAGLAEKAARDAWSFAQVVLKTGRARHGA